MPALLTVRDLAVQAGARRLLSGFALDLAAGEVVALRGPSGSGKTTLLRTLAQLQDAAAGTVELDGEKPADLGFPTWRRRVCYTPQLPAVFPGTVRHNLARPFAYRQGRGDLPHDRARTLLDRLQLGEVALDHDADTLSVGQQQRLAAVRALLLAPAVHLLDEPTSALDPESGQALEALIRADVAGRRAAALVVTHDPAAAARWCDRTLDLAEYRP